MNVPTDIQNIINEWKAEMEHFDTRLEALYQKLYNIRITAQFLEFASEVPESTLSGCKKFHKLVFLMTNFFISYTMSEDDIDPILQRVLPKWTELLQKSFTSNPPSTAKYP